MHFIQPLQSLRDVIEEVNDALGARPSSIISFASG